MSLKALVAGLTLKMKVIIAVAAVLVVGGTAAVVGYNVTKEDAYRVLKVFEMTGDSTVYREGSGDLEAYVGMNLESGDVLSVGDESTLRVVLDNDKYILLDGGTVLELNAAGTAADSRTTVNLRQGTILNEITNPLSANSSYEVNAPKATMAVRGTSFSVSVRDDGSGGYNIDETTYHGLVNVSILDEEGNIIQSEDVGVDKAVDIHTLKNENTGNPAEKDGRAEFVIIDENGSIRPLSDGESPVHDAFYEFVPMLIRSRVVESNNTNLMDIEQNVINRIMGGGNYIENSASNGNGGGIYGDGSSDSMNSDDVPALKPTISEASETEDTAPEIKAVDTENTKISESGAERVGGEVTEGSEAAPQTEAPAEQTEAVPETEAPAELPETAVPETSAPETAAPETAVPETSAPETAAPKTSAPEIEDMGKYIITDEVEKPITKPRNDVSDSGSGMTSPVGNYYYPEITAPSYPTVTTAPVTDTTAPKTTVTETSADETVYYKVSFIANGDVFYSEEVKSGETVSTIPELPATDGYTAVWVYGEGDDVTEFTADTVITEDMIVTAIYTVIPSEYATVTYYASYDSTTPIATEQVAIGSRPTGSSVPQYDSGKAWLIWGFNAADLPIVEKDMNITVPYVAYSDVVEVLMVDGNGSKVLNKLVLKGTMVTLPEMPAELDGKTFIGWGDATSGFEDGTGLKPGSSGVDRVDASHATPQTPSYGAGDQARVDYSTKFYALYKKEITVTFMIGSDTVYQKEAYAGDWIYYSEVGSNITSMDNYRWYYTDDSGEQRFTDYMQVNGDLTISAKPYSVTFTKDGAEPNIVTSYSKQFVLKSDYGNTFEYDGNTYSAGDTITLTGDSTTITVKS